MVISEVAKTKGWVNGEVLRWARERMGLDHESVQELTAKRDHEVKANQLMAWEDGDEEPELPDLEVLAEIYACPVGYFMLDKPPKEELPLNFRGLAPEKIKTLSYESRLRLRQFISFTEYLAYLAGEIRALKPDISSITLHDNIVRIAGSERERLGLSLDARKHLGSAEAAFRICCEKLETLGIFVLSLKLNPREIRGGSRWDPPAPPAILVNDADSEFAAGRLFTLLHEYAHLLLKRASFICDFRGQDREIEHFANAFAAEVLVPKEEFRQFLQKEGLWQKRDTWSDARLDYIRKPFLASRDVVTILLEEHGLAQRGFYIEKYKNWDSRRPFTPRSKKGSKQRRNKFQIKRNLLGSAYTDLIIAGYKRGLVSPLDLADLLDMRIEKAEKFVSWAESQ